MNKWKDKLQLKVKSASLSSYFKSDDNLDSFNSRIESLSFDCSSEEESEEVFKKNSTPKTAIDVASGSCLDKRDKHQEKGVQQTLNEELLEQRRTEEVPDHTFQLRSGIRYLRKSKLNSFPKCNSVKINRNKKNTKSKVVQTGLVRKSSEQLPNIETRSEFKDSAMVFEKVSKLVSRLIPSFSGTNQCSQNELQIFLDCANQVYEALSAEEKSIFLNLLKTRLRGDAYDLVKNVIITSLTQLETLLINTYAPTKTINDHLGDLRKCVQNPSESINAYSGRLSRHLVDCKKAILTKYPENNAALVAEVEQEAIYVFKTGITSPIIRQAVISKTSDSLDQFIDTAKEVEKTELRMSSGRLPNSLNGLDNLTDLKLTSGKVTPILNSNFQENFNFTNSPRILPNQLHNTITTPNLQQLPNVSHSVPRQYTQRYAAQPMGGTNHFRCTFCNRIGHTYEHCRTRQRTPKCTTCNQYGHIASTCTQLQVFYNAYGSTQLPQSRRSKNIKCEWCARWGHDLNTCRAKISYEARKQNNPAEN